MNDKQREFANALWSEMDAMGLGELFRPISESGADPENVRQMDESLACEWIAFDAIADQEWPKGLKRITPGEFCVELEAMDSWLDEPEGPEAIARSAVEELGFEMRELVKRVSLRLWWASREDPQEAARGDVLAPDPEVSNTVHADILAALRGAQQ